jgi:uncharacterized repeat protein (TIGR03803 family)
LPTVKASYSFSFALILLFAAGTSFAGVTVIQNGSPGATSWPGTPAISTLSNPSSASVVESFNGGGGNTNLSQTFTIVAGDFVLQTISIYAGTGTGTGAGTNLTLKLYDLGIQTAPNPSPYAGSIVGGNLFGAGAGLSIGYASQPAGILQFDFTGSDQVTLSNGHMYAFELTGVLNTMPVFWSRGASDTYPGGAAYRNQTWINGNNARDFALAIYAVANENTNNPGMPNGIVFHAFSQLSNGINQDGANPAAGLTLLNGVLCGTTVNGGAQGAGTAFYLKPDASEFNAFRSFAGRPDAANPRGDLTSSGNRLFGTSFAGGSSGVGSIFAGLTNGSVSVLRSFSSVHADTATNSGGAGPVGLLVLSGNTVYGSATAGGVFANGSVFSVSTNGSAYSVLHNFTALDSNTGTNTDGALPAGDLVLSGDTLYGVASGGGAGGNGVVFSVKTNGGNFTALHSFAPMDSTTATNADGAIPLAGLVLVDQVLYGTTSAGGYGGRGTVFSVPTNGLGFNVLHHFPPTDPVSGTNAEGAMPCAALMSSGKLLYGTSAAGGTGAGGTVFSILTNGNQFSALYHFTAIDAATGTNYDGALPLGKLLLLGNSLYGTTYGGGPASVGTVFALPLSGPPAVITNIVLNPDQSVTLYFLGRPNSTNIIQAATNMIPAAWRNVSTNVADINGAWQFTDPNAANAQFYRSYAP